MKVSDTSHCQRQTEGDHASQHERSDANCVSSHAMPLALPFVLYAEQAGRFEKQENQEEAIDDRLSPGGSHKLGTYVLDHTDDHTAQERTCDTAKTAEDHDDEAFYIEKDAYARKDVVERYERHAGDTCGGCADPDGDVIYLVLIDPLQACGFPVDARGPDRPAGTGLLKEQVDGQRREKGSKKTP